MVLHRLHALQPDQSSPPVLVLKMQMCVSQPTPVCHSREHEMRMSMLVWGILKEQHNEMMCSRRELLCMALHLNRSQYTARQSPHGMACLLGLLSLPDGACMSSDAIDSIPVVTCRLDNQEFYCADQGV